MTKIFNRRTRKTLRKKLRNDMPAAEKLLWSKIKGSQINACKFRRQHSIGRYIVDFYCPQLKLAIEVDGDSHYTNEKTEIADRKRQAFIESQAIKMLRFTNTDVYNNLGAVLEAIATATTPNPSLVRRGS